MGVNADSNNVDSKNVDSIMSTPKMSTHSDVDCTNVDSNIVDSHYCRLIIFVDSSFLSTHRHLCRLSLMSTTIYVTLMSTPLSNRQKLAKKLVIGLTRQRIVKVKFLPAYVKRMYVVG